MQRSPTTQTKREELSQITSEFRLNKIIRFPLFLIHKVTYMCFMGVYLVHPSNLMPRRKKNTIIALTQHSIFSLFTIKAWICANLLTTRANQQEVINPWTENRSGITYTGITNKMRTIISVNFRLNKIKNIGLSL